MRIGITGLAGSGKSSVASMFGKYGVSIIDADEVIEELYKDASAVTSALRGVFGENIITDGAIDKNKIREIVFSDNEKLKKLCDIMHPYARAKIENYMASMEGSIIVEASQLFEANWQDLFDVVILVISSPKKRETRLMGKGLSAADVENLFSIATPKMRFLPFVDYVIDNDGHPASTQKQVDILWEELER